MKRWLVSLLLGLAIVACPIECKATETDDLMLVAALVWHEAGNQCYDGKRLVADVVFNRVMSPDFPGTIQEVLDQKWQFMPVTELRKIVDAGKVPQDCIDAVYDELDDQLDFEVLYFNNELATLSGTYAYQLGDHYFGK